MIRTSGELRFQVDARHVRQLGQELVADRVTALSELIKNAYDADARKVRVLFAEGAEVPGSILEIHDDGNGMTLEDIRDRWMRISTGNKEDASVSPRFGRSRAGRKGIGRFAVETLGRRLILSSTVSGRVERVVVTFDWHEYLAGTDLEEIGNTYRVEPADESEHSTLLRIEGLHQGWTEDAIRRVRKAVLLLQPPFPVAAAVRQKAHVEGYEPDSGFSVEIAWEGRERVGEESGLSDFLAAATATISGKVSEDGKGGWQVESRLFELNDRQEFPTAPLVTGPFAFEASYFVYSAGAIGSISRAVAQRMGNEYGGMRLYRDGLRILPYGERGNDWLGLDEAYRRRVVLVPIGNNNFFGQVSVTREDNVFLVDTASREGVIENQAFLELREFVARGLIWGALRVGAARNRKERAGDKPNRAPSRKDLVERAAAAARLTENGGDADAIRRDLEELQREAERADQEDRQAHEVLLGEMDLLRVLASLGTSIAVFSHEVRGTLNNATSTLSDVEEEVRKACLRPEHPLVERLVDAQDGLEHVGELGSYLSMCA